ncbi:MAG TPA: hypothetical protein VH497_05430 [Vicinamibacterales bacterium]
MISCAMETMMASTHRLLKRLVLTAALLPAPAALSAQPAAVTTDVRPADVATPDAIIAAVYASISGPAGQPRDWARFRSLLIPGARLIPSARRTAGATTPVVWSAEEYIAAAGAGLERQGFFEREIHRTTEAFGAVLHAFSTYDSKRTPDGQPFARGINSMQLYNDGTRWWIVTIFWDAETADKPIPAKYLSR